MTLTDLFFDATSSRTGVTVSMVRDGGDVRPATDIELRLLDALYAERKTHARWVDERMLAATVAYIRGRDDILADAEALAGTAEPLDVDRLRDAMTGWFTFDGERWRLVSMAEDGGMVLTDDFGAFAVAISHEYAALGGIDHD